VQEQNIAILSNAILHLNPQMNKDALDYLLESCTFSTYKNKEEIIKPLEKQRKLYFLTSGLVRGYYIDDNGNDITIRFVNNQGWITHYTALLSSTPSKYTFQCLEECTVIELPFELIQKGYNQFSSLERLGRLIAESVLKTQQARIESFQFLDAKERYLEFLNNYPELFNRVSLSHLCTYLGIQRQSLTRIRKKIASR
jgi:CRP/FNR family transcriptional regulator